MRTGGPRWYRCTSAIAISSVTRPIKELRGFKKVWLNPGETTTVEIAISPASLAFYDIDMNYVVEPGEFAIMVGTSSRDSDLQSVTLRVDDAPHGRHA